MGKCLFLRKGETHTAPLSGILANTLSVGSTVKLMENGTAVEYLVVHQGLPSSMYDASCDGMWLMRKDLYESRAWHSSDVNDYANSTIHAYLNGDFFNLLGAKEQAAIKQVKIPYRPGSGSSKTVNSGANGLSAKIFLLSGYEVGWTTGDTSDFSVEGACISYFNGTSSVDSKRIAYLNGTKTYWWLRSPYCYSTTGVFYVGDNGDWHSMGAHFSSGIRPALVLPSTALFDKNTLILKGVA